MSTTEPASQYGGAGFVLWIGRAALEVTMAAMPRMVWEPLSTEEALALQGTGFDFSNDEIERLSADAESDG